MNEILISSPSFLQPTNFSEFERFSKMISDSDFAPKDYKGKPGNVMIAVQMGYELGLQPLQALQNISVINNRAVVWGDLLIALVRSKSICKSVHEWMEGNIKENTAVAHCEVTRENEKVLRSFSIDQARRAGLTSKQGPWQQYPERMLAMRARGFALRDAFADVLKGIYVREEMEGSAYNEQDEFSPVTKIGNEAIKNEIIESEFTTLGSKSKSDELSDEMNNCSSVEELREIGLKIKQENLSLSDKKRLADIYRQNLNVINSEKETIIEENTTEEENAIKE